ncbi:MAG TPA: hypothetical protein VN436_03325 [Holophaga sp.]|nr:hypothetical protein [Holophaga sp.]
MSDTFLARIPTLSDAELREYLAHPADYKPEALEAALAELARRGLQPSGSEQAALRHATQAGPPTHRKTLGRSAARRILAAILGLGFGASAIAYLRAPSVGAYDLHPEDSKTYVREMEVIGGKANLMAAEFNHWFAGLWQGRSLALTLAVLTLLLAAGFWFVALRDQA